MKCYVVFCSSIDNYSNLVGIYTTRVKAWQVARALYGLQAEVKEVEMDKAINEG